MKVAIYARVSTRDKGQDVENQLAELLKFCERQQWTVYQVYRDNESAKTADRDQFQKLMADAHRGRFDLVLFWALDRFTREGVLPTLQHLNRLTSYGVAYKSFTEQYLDSLGIFRDAVISILATIAKQERLRIGERTRAGMAVARAKGVVLGRKRVEADAERIHILRSQGLSWRAVARELGIGLGTARRAAQNRAKKALPENA